MTNINEIIEAAYNVWRPIMERYAQTHGRNDKPNEALVRSLENESLVRAIACLCEATDRRNWVRAVCTRDLDNAERYVDQELKMAAKYFVLKAFASGKAMATWRPEYVQSYAHTPEMQDTFHKLVAEHMVD